MKLLRAAFIVGFLTAVLFTPCDAQTGGGFPYNPTFGRVNVLGSTLPLISVRKANQTCPASGNTYAMEVCTPASGTANGLRIHAGTNSSDNSLVVSNAADTINFLIINGAGAITTPGATAVPWGTASQTDSGSLTWSFQTANSGCSVNGTDTTVLLHKIGTVVTGQVTGNGTCTVPSSANLTTTNTPVPASFRPASAVQCGSASLTDTANPGGTAGSICVTSAGNLRAQTFQSAQAAIGTVGLASFVYTLD